MGNVEIFEIWGMEPPAVAFEIWNDNDVLQEEIKELFGEEIATRYEIWQGEQ